MFPDTESMFTLLRGAGSQRVFAHCRAICCMYCGHFRRKAKLTEVKCLTL